MECCYILVVSDDEDDCYFLNLRLFIMNWEFDDREDLG